MGWPWGWGVPQEPGPTSRATLRVFSQRRQAARQELEDDFSYARELRDREKRLQALQEQLERKARWVLWVASPSGLTLQGRGCRQTALISVMVIPLLF